MSAMSAAESFGPGLRMAAEAIAPRLSEQVLAHREAQRRLLLVAGERQVGVEEVVGALDVAGRVGAPRRPPSSRGS